MRRILCVVLLAAVLSTVLSGCGQKDAAGAFTADDEIATYTKIDMKKTQIVVSRLGNNAPIEDISAAFEAFNPDVQVVCIDITAGTADYSPAVDWVTHSVAPDIMFVNTKTFTDESQVEEYFENLSINPVIENFDAQALDSIAVNGFVYFLPAPSEINCMLYNKTLFERYGWQIPGTFDEFVALCERIKEDTAGEVQPWNPNAKYDPVLTTALEAFTYEEVFGGVNNRSWYNHFCEGTASFAGHMEPFFDMLQTLIDRRIILPEHFSYSATTRGKEFESGKIAMYNAAVSHINSDAYEFDYMPYPSTKGSLGYINSYFSALMCVPKKEHTAAEKDAINRYIAYFGSVEGQRALIGNSLCVSNVKNVPLADEQGLAGLEAAIDQGHTFRQLDFTSNLGIKNWTFKECAQDMLSGKTGAQLIAEIDAKPYKSPEESAPAPSEKLAQVTKDMTILETSCYFADMYREKAQADIGLINHGIAYRGNLVKLFAGDIYKSYVNPIKPRSFANGSTLVKVSMTGRQLLDALDNPVGNGCTSDSVYAVSGLKCEIAPWNELGRKYLSVKLADGTAIDDEKLYTVAFWDGTVDERYITEKLEAYEGTWEELTTEKFASDKTVAPADDGRIKLVWK